MSDPIDRQAAIDALSMMQGIVAENGVRKGISMAWQQIKDLPSAQPEIIRCKDCIEWDSACEWCNRHGGTMQEDDFCSRAEPYKGEQECTKKI